VSINVSFVHVLNVYVISCAAASLWVLTYVKGITVYYMVHILAKLHMSFGCQVFFHPILNATLLSSHNDGLSVSIWSC
jgi:hypothetical protein